MMHVFPVSLRLSQREVDELAGICKTKGGYYAIQALEARHQIRHNDAIRVVKAIRSLHSSTG